MMAEDKGLDLIVVSPNQEPPVAKILDYGKYKYEVEKRAKESKKKQHTVDVKEIKVRYKIDIHDYNVKINAIKKFLASGNNSSSFSANPPPVPPNVNAGLTMTG